MCLSMSAACGRLDQNAVADRSGPYQPSKKTWFNRYDPFIDATIDALFTSTIRFSSSKITISPT
jgi:hypothetical protein